MRPLQDCSRHASDGIARFSHRHARANLRRLDSPVGLGGPPLRKAAKMPPHNSHVAVGASLFIAARSLFIILLFSITFSTAFGQRLQPEINLPQFDYSRFKTVDDILAGSAFEKVTPKEYPDAIKKGRALVLFYENASPGDSPSGRLAMVVSEISKQYPSLNYIALPRNATLPHDVYLKFGFEVSPDFMIYENGKMVFRNPGKNPEGKRGGGPNPGREFVFINGLQKELERLFPGLRR